MQLCLAVLPQTHPTSPLPSTRAAKRVYLLYATILPVVDYCHHQHAYLW